MSSFRYGSLFSTRPRRQPVIRIVNGKIVGQITYDFRVFMYDSCTIDFFQNIISTIYSIQPGL